MKKVIILFLNFLLFVACAPNEKNFVLQKSNGGINQILVVMNHNLWKGVEGDELRKVTGEEVLGLPQQEPQFDVTQIPVNAYKNLFTSQSKILIVKLGKKDDFNIKTNVFAAPQIIISITAKTKNNLIKLIQENKETIITKFKNLDIQRVQEKLRERKFDISQLKTFKNIGISLEIPSTYRKVDDTGDFLWFRNNLKQGQSINLLVYQLPINSPDDELGKNIVAMRDTIGKKYIPGQYDGTYLITEAAYSPHTFIIEMQGKKAFETRGKWEVKGDFMAGPFLNYTIVDKPKNRLIVIEGFAYSPTTNKRDFMFEVEAILKTLKINQ